MVFCLFGVLGIGDTLRLKRILCAVSLGVHSLWLCAVEGGMMLVHSQIRSEQAPQRREPHHLSNEEPVDLPQYIKWKAGGGWGGTTSEEERVSGGEKVLYIWGLSSVHLQGIERFFCENYWNDDEWPFFGGMGHYYLRHHLYGMAYGTAYGTAWGIWLTAWLTE